MMRAISSFMRRSLYRMFRLHREWLATSVDNSQRAGPALNSEYDETSQSAELYKISQLLFFISRKILKRSYLA
jgi:hypothetical protein